MGETDQAGSSPKEQQEQTASQTTAPTGTEKPRALRVVYRDWRNNPSQARLIISDNKRIIVRAGRRGGKTVGAAQRAVLAFRRRRRVLYGVPTTDQLKKFWFEVKLALAELIDAGVVDKNESEHFIEVPGTENRIRAKTCWNADTLRGDYADLLILDEWQLMSEDTWEDVGAPMLIDNHGDAVFIYTPPSLQSASVTKARDPRHAAKMYERALDEMRAAERENRKSRWLAIHFASTENPYLDEAGLAEVTRDMTVASFRREVLALDANIVPGALWTAEMIEATRVSFDQVPDLETVVVGVDPTGSSTNEAGIVACGKGAAPRGWKPTPEILKICPDVLDKKHMYVLFDRSRRAPTSHEWAQAAVDLYFDARADALLGERNYGGDMVASTISNVENGDKVMYRDVSATRGKMVRAAPIAAATERGLVHIVGSMPELEDELTSYVPGNNSPNRMDAMVWGGVRILEGLDESGLVEYFKMLAAHGGDEAKLAEEIRSKQRPRQGDALVEKSVVEVFEEKPIGARAAYLAKREGKDFGERGVFGRFGR